jgi:hypothetical protein
MRRHRIERKIRLSGISPPVWSAAERLGGFTEQRLGRLAGRFSHDGSSSAKP